jgi:copper chaperone CopZ
MTTTVQFEGLGEETIHCAGCESRIAAALGRLPGGEEVQASAETQQVKGIINPSRTKEDEVRARLEKLGYEVR